MKLNPDCVRAILLTIEENSSYKSFLQFGAENLSYFPHLTEYSLDEVLYHLKNVTKRSYFAAHNSFLIPRWWKRCIFAGTNF